MGKKTNFQVQPMRFKRFSGKRYSVFHSLRRVVNIGVVSGLALASAYVSTASAQNTTSRTQAPELEEGKELEEVVVSASKVATPLNQTAKLVSVITQAQIAKAPVRSIQELLNYLASVDVTQRGGHGVQADISIRGGSFDQNAVLLNGINLSNASTGHLSYDIPLNLSDIERIEILHGPSALVYGTSAFSGGINIITKKDVAERIYTYASLGQHKTTELELRGATNIGRTTNSLSLGHKRSDGYRENTDYRLFNALWQTRYGINVYNHIDLQLGYQKKAFGANSFYSARSLKQYEETSSMVSSLSGRLGNERLTIVPMLYWQRGYDEYHWIRGTALNHHRTTNYGANLIASYRSSLGMTSLGMELRHEGILSSKLGYPRTGTNLGKYTHEASRTNSAISLEHTLTLTHWTLTAGAMLNHNTQRKGKYELFPSLGLTYRPTDRLSIATSWSKAIRLPTFIDLFYSDPASQGNPNLSHESSQSLDLSLRYRSHRWSGYLSAFSQQGRDIIDWVKPSLSATKYQTMNLSRVDTYGIEAGLHLPLFVDNCSLRLDYTHLWQSHDSNGLISRYALRYLRDKFTAQFDHPIMRGLTATWSFRWQKRMGQYESGIDASGAIIYSSYDPFSTLDLRLDYEASRQLRFNLQINNLTNTEYFDLPAIPQPRLWATFGLSYSLR